MSVHPTAARGFHGDIYERGRPGYPEDAVDALLRGVGAGVRAIVVDLGAGTGKLTRALAGYGVRPVAIDPIPDMLAALRRTSPHIAVAGGAAERLPVASERIAALLCAQSFHWFRTEEALAEIHRVLVPGGGLGLIWNRRDVRVGWVARLWDGIVEPRRGDTPGHETVAWRDVVESSPLFGPVTEQTFETTQSCDVDSLLARIDSTSFINTMEADEKAALFERIRDFCRTDPGLAGREVFDLPYRTFVYTCRRS